LAALFDLIRVLNTQADEGRLNATDAAAALKLLEEWDQVLGVLPLHKKEDVPHHLIELLKQRNQARTEKNWKLSDQIRDEILAEGYLIEDTATGNRLKKK
jgi:cysteinyl-tRNA synthetase